MPSYQVNFTLAISLQLLPASRMLFSRRSSSAVQGVFVLLLLTAGEGEGSGCSSVADLGPPGSPYAGIDEMLTLLSKGDAGAFRFREVVGLGGGSVLSRLVSWLGPDELEVVVTGAGSIGGGMEELEVGFACLRVGVVNLEASSDVNGWTLSEHNDALLRIMLNGGGEQRRIQLTT